MSQSENPNAEVLLKASMYRNIPFKPIRNFFPRLMAAIWEMGSEDYAEDHPEIMAALRKDPDDPRGCAFLVYAMEAHTWKNFGVQATDYIFPTFFGTKLKEYHEVDGVMVPAPEEDES